MFTSTLAVRSERRTSVQVLPATMHTPMPQCVRLSDLTASEVHKKEVHTSYSKAGWTKMCASGFLTDPTQTKSTWPHQGSKWFSLRKKRSQNGSSWGAVCLSIRGTNFQNGSSRGLFQLHFFFLSVCQKSLKSAYNQHETNQGIRGACPLGMGRPLNFGPKILFYFYIFSRVPTPFEWAQTSRPH